MKMINLKILYLLLLKELKVIQNICYLLKKEFKLNLKKILQNSQIQDNFNVYMLKAMEMTNYCLQVLQCRLRVGNQLNSIMQIIKLLIVLQIVKLLFVKEDLHQLHLFHLLIMMMKMLELMMKMMVHLMKKNHLILKHINLIVLN